MRVNIQQKASHACRGILARLSHLVAVQALCLAGSILSQPPSVRQQGLPRHAHATSHQILLYMDWKTQEGSA